MERLNNLRSIREHKCFTRKELSLLSGVKEITIASLENGITDVNNVKLSTLIKLAKALKCKVVDLLDKDLRKIIA